MNNVISIAAVRSEKMKQALSVHCRTGEAAIVEARRAGTILAERIICRDQFAEILNSVGDYLVLDYADIRSIRPAAVAQTSIVNASGGFQFAPQITPGTRTVPVLPFAPRQRRRP
jgi:hypothetical protein